MSEVENAQGTQESTQVQAPIVPEAAKTDAERLQRAIAAVEKPPEAAPKAETKPPELSQKPQEPPKKPEELVSPQLAALLKKDKAVDEKINAFKAEKAAWEKERGSFESYHKKLRTDGVSALKEAGITDVEGWLRDTYYSILPEDKQPRDLKQRRFVSEEVHSLRTELQKEREWREKREAAEAAAQKAAEEKAAQEAKAAQDKADLDAYMGRVTGSVADESVFVKDLLANEPEDAKGLLFNAAIALAQQQQKEPDPKEVVALVEKHLATQYERAERAKKTTKQVGERPQATKQLTAKQTATPTHSRGPAVTDAERMQRAAEKVQGLWK